jgi:hypothetical protein
MGVATTTPMIKHKILIMKPSALVRDTIYNPSANIYIDSGLNLFFIIDKTAIPNRG